MAQPRGSRAGRSIGRACEARSSSWTSGRTAAATACARCPTCGRCTSGWRRAASSSACTRPNSPPSARAATWRTRCGAIGWGTPSRWTTITRSGARGANGAGPRNGSSTSGAESRTRPWAKEPTRRSRRPPRRCWTSRSLDGPALDERLERLEERLPAPREAVEPLLLAFEAFVRERHARPLGRLVELPRHGAPPGRVVLQRDLLVLDELQDRRAHAAFRPLERDGAARLEAHRRPVHVPRAQRFVRPERVVDLRRA